MRQDIENLRQLARHYAAAAAHPRNKENEKLYRAVNGLRMIRPVVLVDAQPWPELLADGALEMRCQDPFFRGYELYLRQKLFQWTHHPADMILLPYIPVKKMIGGEPGGMPIQETTLFAAAEENSKICSHAYADQLENEADIAKIRMPSLTYERAATESARDRLDEAIGDIVPVRITGHDCYISQWDTIAQYRGVSSLLIDLVERPEHTHAIMERVTRMYIERCRQFEALGLLEAELPLVHCTAAYCDDLRAPGAGPVLRQNVWGRCMAQIFASVSPAMHEEFEIEYQKRTMEPFGLVYYGCCEPLDRKIDIVRKIPHLRKISITPWADIHVAAEAIGKDFVVAAKPNPAHVGGPFDAAVVRREIENILDACYRYGCSCDIVLKDISTVGHRPENLRLWERTVMDVVKSH